VRSSLRILPSLDVDDSRQPRPAVMMRCSLAAPLLSPSVPPVQGQVVGLTVNELTRESSDEGPAPAAVVPLFFGTGTMLLLLLLLLLSLPQLLLMDQTAGASCGVPELEQRRSKRRRS
jgi:hypothetical protein